MSDINTAFCRNLLAIVKLDLTGRELRQLKNAGLTWSGPPHRRYYFFEWPKMDGKDGTFYWEGQADNANDARAQALQDWLKDYAVDYRASHTGEL